MHASSKHKPSDGSIFRPLTEDGSLHCLSLPRQSAIVAFNGESVFRYGMLANDTEREHRRNDTWKSNELSGEWEDNESHERGERATKENTLQRIATHRNAQPFCTEKPVRKKTHNKTTQLCWIFSGIVCYLQEWFACSVARSYSSGLLLLYVYMLSVSYREVSHSVCNAIAHSVSVHVSLSIGTVRTSLFFAIRHCVLCVCGWENNCPKFFPNISQRCEIYSEKWTRVSGDNTVSNVTYAVWSGPVFGNKRIIFTTFGEKIAYVK